MPNYIVLIIISFGWSMLFEFTMRKGMIFEFYGDWLAKLHPKIGKPLGYCIFCSNPYQTVLWSLILGSDWTGVLMAIAVNHVLLLVADRLKFI